MSDPNEADKCRAVTDVAIDAAVKKCGSVEAVRKQVMDMFGYADDEECPDCELLLEGGVTEDVLESVTAERNYAMCRAMELIEEEDVPFRQAVNRAWMEIREAEGVVG